MLLWQFYLYEVVKITYIFNVYLAFLAYKVDPSLFTGRSIHLRLVASMLCFSDKWSVLGHFNHLDNKLAIKGPMGPNFLTAWEKAQKFQFCHFWPFSVCAHFASSFWQSSCDFSSIKILLKSYSSNLIISSK